MENMFEQGNLIKHWPKPYFLNHNTMVKVQLMQFNSSSYTDVIIRI